jgi:tetratricopeptide (TPR) repeat protein
MDKGHCLSILGRKDEARTSFAMAIDEHPVRAEAHYHLGDLAYNQQRFGEAEAWLEKCITLPMPQCRLFLVPRVYWVMRHDLLSMVYHHTGKIKQAIEQAEIALEKVNDARIKKNVALWKEHLNKRNPPEIGRSRSPIDLCSHKRSGTHFFMATLWHNFELPDVSVSAVIPNGRSFVDVEGTVFKPGDTVDIPWGGLWRTHGMWNGKAFDPKRTIYIVRSPFDTLMSYWRFTNPLNEPPLTHEMADKLVEHWYQQTLGYADSGCIVVKYEDLVGDEHDLVLMDVEQRCGLKRKRESLERFEKMVGWYSDVKAHQLSEETQQILRDSILKIVPAGFLGYL